MNTLCEDPTTSFDFDTDRKSGLILISVIIPAYNEAGRLGETLGLLEAVGKDCVLEVIVVCDGCTDRTREVALEWSSQFHLQVIHYPDNQGKGYAVAQGVQAASGDIIAFMDADGSTPPSELLRLVDPILCGQADVVIGSRRAEGAVVERQPLHRHLLGKLFSVMTQGVLSLPYQDTQCGFKLFRRKSAKILFEDLKWNGFGFDLDILYRAVKNKLRISEVGVSWHDCAGSKVLPVRDGFKMALTMFQIRMYYRRCPSVLEIMVHSFAREQ